MADDDEKKEKEEEEILKRRLREIGEEFGAEYPKELLRGTRHEIIFRIRQMKKDAGKNKEKKEDKDE